MPLIVTAGVPEPADPAGIVKVEAAVLFMFTSVTSVPLVNVVVVALVDAVGVRIQVESVAVGLIKMTLPDPVMVMVEVVPDNVCEMLVAGRP